MRMNLAGVFIAGLLLSPYPARADQKTFVISATIPASTSIGITANRVNAATNVWTPINTTSLSMGNLSLNSTLGTYFPNDYFVIDAAPQGAVSDYQVTYTYQEGSNPNAPGHGLGWKSSATFMSTSGAGNATSDQLLSGHGKKLLKDVINETVTKSELGIGWSRVYLGAITKDPAATIPDPAAGELFNIGDKPGEFSGTLTITTTAL